MEPPARIVTMTPRQVEQHRQSLVDVVMGEGTQNGEIVSARIVPADDPRYKANSEANYNHVCANHFGRGTELCKEVRITKEKAGAVIREWEASPECPM
jgi:hypothetical protein